MYYGREDNSYMNHWYKWASVSTEREELFEDVRQLVDDMINEIVPRLLEERLKINEKRY